MQIGQMMKLKPSSLEQNNVDSILNNVADIVVNIFPEIAPPSQPR